MSKQYHSHAYHRYFENYAEKEVLSPDGGSTILRVYVGNYYRAELPDHVLRARKRGVGLGYFGILAGFLIGGRLAKVSAVSWVAIATMPALIAVLFLAFPVFSYLKAPREMEIREYRDSSINLISGSLASAICLAVCFAATLAGVLIFPDFSLTQNLPSLALYFLAMICAFLIFALEKRTVYLELPPRQERPAESSPIRYEMPE